MDNQWAYLFSIILMSLFPCLFVGLIPATIAHYKGKDFLLWWLFGTVLFIFALPAIILSKSDQEVLETRAFERGMRKCPYCAELVKKEADLCKFCRSQLPDEDELFPRDIECPFCGEKISLSAQERITGKFICCKCQKAVDMTDKLAQNVQ